MFKPYLMAEAKFPKSNHVIEYGISEIKTHTEGGEEGERRGQMDGQTYGWTDRWTETESDRQSQRMN